MAKLNFEKLQVKILHYVSKLNFLANGVKFSVLELICTYAW